MQPPKWAKQMVAEVCRTHGRKQPKLVWRRKRRSCSSGRATYGRISIVAGYDPIDARLVLLHELAHTLSNWRKPPRTHSEWSRANTVIRVSGHPLRFWRKAWRLYAKYGIPLEYAKKREWDYMAKAKRAYYQVKPWET